MRRKDAPYIPESHPLLAREGWAHIGIALAFALVATWLWGAWSIPVWLAFAFVVQFFRDPRRQIGDLPGAVVAPADGKVVSIDVATDPCLGRQARKISVFMNVFSVHSNRAPVGGRVDNRWYHAGRFVNAVLDKASAENERSGICLTTADGHRVVCVQVAGLIARRILCYVSEGDQVSRGQRYGFIRFGSRVDCYLPLEAEVMVRLGQWVSAGSDIIAKLDPIEAQD